MKDEKEAEKAHGENAVFREVKLSRKKEKKGRRKGGGIRGWGFANRADVHHAAG